MTKTPPVADWATDYDIFDPGYIADPVPIWNDLRARCPIARTERWGGSWLPTRYADMQAFVRMVPQLSSRLVLVASPPKEEEEYDPVLAEIGYPLRSRDVNMLGWRTRHPIPKAGSTTRAP